MSEQFKIDAYAPAEIAARVESSGINKVNLPILRTVALGILAGAFIFLAAFLTPHPSIAGDAKIGASLAKRFKCTSCHGRAGQRSSTPIPFLQGQHKRYLITQLKMFRDGDAKKSGDLKITERHNKLMSKQAAKLTNKAIDHLATFFSEESCVSVNKSTAEIERPQKAKACAFCHGEQGRSFFVTYPKLAGQNMAYLIKQLKALRAGAKYSGEKNARFHRIMAAQVISLTNAEIVALSYYYAKQSCR